MKRILVADDEEVIRNLYTRAFGSQYDLRVAESGTKALQMLYADNFDGAILDNNMGGPTGLTILETLRRDGRQTPVVICCEPTSIQEEDILITRTQELGNARYVQKTLGLAELRRNAQELFGDPNI